MKSIIKTSLFLKQLRDWKIMINLVNQTRSMYKHKFNKRVRYSETDKMGFLYYGNYPALYEIGRVEMIRSLGLSYQKMEDEMGIMLPVVNLEVRYLLPAYYDEELEIHTILDEMPGKIILFRHEVYNQEKTLINKATVKLFFTDTKTNKRISAPSSITDALKEYF